MAPSPLKCPSCSSNVIPYAPVPEDLLNASRMTALLATNDPPYAAESSVLQASASEITKQVHTLERRIEDLESALDDMRGQRRTLENAKARQKAILHPLRRLPNELLLEIFKEGSRVNNDLSRDNVLTTSSPTAMPWSASRVCRRWRETCLGCPRLWSTIRIAWNQDEYTNVVYRRTLFFLGLQIERSASCDLKISLYAPRAMILRDNDIILSMLLPTSPRWKYLYARMTLESFPALARIRGNLQLLETIHITPRGLSGSNASISRPLLSMFDFIPRLKTCIGYVRLVLLSDIPLSQIQRWEYPSEGRSAAWQSHETHLSLLRAAKNLEHCSLLCGNAIPMQQRPYPVCHEKLTSLSLVEEKTQNFAACNMLSCLSFPALTSFELTGQVNHTIVSEFLDRSQCRLTSLRIKSPQMKIHMCLSILELTKYLKYLELHFSRAMDTDFLSAFIDNEGDDILVPELEKLVLTGATEDESSDLLLIELQESRAGTLSVDASFEAAVVTKKAW